VSEAKKVCLEIEENRVSKENKDIWVFQEMLVKKESKENKEGLESPVSQDFLENQEDQVILDYLVKWEIKVFQENQVIKVKEVKEGLLVRLVKKVKKVAQVKKEIKAIKVKKETKGTKDFLEHWEIKDPEVTKVFEENRVKEAKKVIWVIADHLEIRAQLENPVVKVSLVR